MRKRRGSAGRGRGAGIALGRSRTAPPVGAMPNAGRSAAKVMGGNGNQPQGMPPGVPADRERSPEKSSNFLPPIPKSDHRSRENWAWVPGCPSDCRIPGKMDSPFEKTSCRSGKEENWKNRRSPNRRPARHGILGKIVLSRFYRSSEPTNFARPKSAEDSFCSASLIARTTLL